MPDALPALSVTAFPALFESAPDGIVIVNDLGQIILVNSQAERLFGYGRMELINQPSESLMPARFRERHRKFRAKLIRDPKSRASGAPLDLYGLRKDGTEFQAEISLTPVQTEDVRRVRDRQLRRVEAVDRHVVAGHRRQGA